MVAGHAHAHSHNHTHTHTYTHYLTLTALSGSVFAAPVLPSVKDLSCKPSSARPFLETRTKQVRPWPGLLSPCPNTCSSEGLAGWGGRGQAVQSVPTLYNTRDTSLPETSTLDAQHLARRHPGDSVRGRSQRLVMQPGDLGFWGRLGTHECRASPGLTRPTVWKVKKCERFSLGNTYGTFRTRPGNRHALSSELPPGARAGGRPHGWYGASLSSRWKGYQPSRQNPEWLISGP